jgi:hypothetical protein
MAEHASRFAAYEFLITELSTARTFAEIAEKARDPEKRQRKRENAQAAYDTVVQFLPRAILDAAQLEEVEQGLDLLKVAIDRI